MTSNPELKAKNHSPSFVVSQKNDINIDKDEVKFKNSIPLDSQDDGNILLSNKIDQITRYQKPYVKRVLMDILHHSPVNAKQICDFINAERDEINIKESTAEWHIKVLGQLLRFHNFKDFKSISKDDILNFLNSLRKTTEEDPINISIGNRNNKQRVLLKYFKWLYNPYVDYKNRPTPSCMNGINILPRKESSPYKHQTFGLKETMTYS